MNQPDLTILSDPINITLTHFDLTTLRLALRQAAVHDLIGCFDEFAALYRRLGGTADLAAERIDRE